MDPYEHNRRAWNAQVAQGSPWTRPVTPAEVDAARRGVLELKLTPARPVPADWLPPLPGRSVLVLAGGGGQQGPLLAAAGARVTVLDASDAQLEQDRLVARRDGLDLTLRQGDMRDLGPFPDATFDLIVHPVANLYVPDLEPVWQGTSRVLRPGGTLLAGFMNPHVYLFDQGWTGPGAPCVKYGLPYSELTSLPAEERDQLIAEGDVLQFGHSLEAQLGGQMAAGFALTGLLEDRRPGHPLAPYLATHLLSRAVKVG